MSDDVEHLELVRKNRPEDPRRLARHYAPTAVEFLNDVVHDRSANLDWRIEAARVLLETAFGG